MGYEERLERTRELLAWHAATQINNMGWSKGTVKPHELLGYGKPKESAEGYKNMVEEHGWPSRTK